MTIEEMQEAIHALGWQWQEFVFNDSNSADCMLRFSQSRSPHAFDTQHEDYDAPLGWGRFPRFVCWGRAYDYIVKGERR